jgi:hypothetical protein
MNIKSLKSKLIYFLKRQLSKRRVQHVPSPVQGRPADWQPIVQQQSQGVSAYGTQPIMVQGQPQHQPHVIYYQDPHPVTQ